MRNFYGLLILIAMDSDMHLRSIDNIVWPEGYDWYDLDRDAAQLNITDAETFAFGEATEAEAIAKKYGIQQLHDVLNEAFDGDLYDTFFVS